MNTKNQGGPPLYDNAFKIAISREYLTSSLGYGALAKKYGLALHTVNGFVRWYKKRYPEHLQSTDNLKDQQPSDSERESLVTQLREANLKIAGLEMLIETAEKELDIDIVKKPGTKQLLK